MGILQNHAIKKSCTGLARELLIYFRDYALENAKEDDEFDHIFLNGLHSFALNNPTFKILCPTFDPSRFEDWKDLYNFILFIGVKTDLAYDSTIGNAEHYALIKKIGFKELEDFLKRECR